MPSTQLLLDGPGTLGASERRSRSPRWLLVGDLGGPAEFHVGDEAMFEANLDALRMLSPGAAVVAYSSAPEWTRRRYAVEAIAPPSPIDRPPEASWDVDRDLRERTNWLIGDSWVRAVESADAVLISGGGNLCSTWPHKIAERAGLIHCGRDLGKPVIVVGQTLGPQLSERERDFLGAALVRVDLLGVRELPSCELALGMGVSQDRLRLQFDDAFFLAGADGGAWREPLADLDRPWILVTVDASWGSSQNRLRLTGLATQLAGVASALDGELVFVPHVGGESVPEGQADLTVGRKLSALLGGRLTLLGVGTPAEVRGLVGEAALVISTRYHPLVFAVASGVPAIGIHADEYTRVKLQGAMTHAGQIRWTVMADAAAQGQLLPMALELWQLREAVSAASRSVSRDALREAQARWKEIGDLLGIESADSPESRSTPEVLKPSQPGAGTMSRMLSEDEWQEYEEKGYLRLGRVLDDAALAALQRRIDEIMLGRVTYPQLQFQMDTGGAYEELPDPVNGLITSTLAYRKVQGLEADPLFLALLRQELFREICARHYGAHAAVSIFRAMMMNKPANQGTYLPWHQDAGDVWKLDRDPEVTLWVALDPATKANGCVQVVPGTHRLGLLSKNGSTISDENVARHCPDSAVEYLEIGAGEGLLLHNWLLHRSDVNRTDRPRRAFTACYMDGRTLNTLTGTRFPIIFGEYEDVEDAMLFVRAMNEDNRNLRQTAEEATRYAKSLEEAVLHMRSNSLRARVRRLLGG